MEALDEIENRGRRVHVRVPADLHQELKVKAAQERVNLQDLTEQILRQALAGDRAAA